MKKLREKERAGFWPKGVEGSFFIFQSLIAN
jgi:hypothetical protein